jgi:CRP-like cAMP-binding protein
MDCRMLLSPALHNRQGYRVRNPLMTKLERAGTLSAEDRAKLAALISCTYEVAAREDIVREGDRPREVHVMMDGFACRYKMMAGGRRAILAYLVPGDFCDLHAAVLGRMDHAVGTLAPCTMAAIPRAALEEAASRPAIARALCRAALADEAILREWLANMGQQAADRQLAHLLCELRRRLQAVGLADGRSFRLPLTQEELGDALGISTVHVNRVLQCLRALRLIETNGRSIIIPHAELLETFAGFDPGYLYLAPAESAPAPQ